jgi:hypothetical protein
MLKCGLCGSEITFEVEQGKVCWRCVSCRKIYPMNTSCVHAPVKPIVEKVREPKRSMWDRFVRWMSQP